MSTEYKKTLLARLSNPNTLFSLIMAAGTELNQYSVNLFISILNSGGSVSSFDCPLLICMLSWSHYFHFYSASLLSSVSYIYHAASPREGFDLAALTAALRLSALLSSLKNIGIDAVVIADQITPIIASGAIHSVLISVLLVNCIYREFCMTFFPLW